MSNSYRFEMLALQVVNLENVDQGQGVQILYCYHSMENIKSYQRRIWYFMLALTISEI